MAKDWKAWAANHAHPIAAARVVAWLEKHDPDEPTWRAADDLVELVADVVVDCSEHVIRFEGVDFDMRERMLGPR